MELKGKWKDEMKRKKAMKRMMVMVDTICVWRNERQEIKETKKRFCNVENKNKRGKPEEKGTEARTVRGPKGKFSILWISTTIVTRSCLFDHWIHKWILF